jgi:hypothetical protein
MPRYVIEREISGAGQLSPAELQGASRRSCLALAEMGTHIQWVHSYVTGDKIYCVYISPDEATLKEHAQRSGFPADRISAITAVIDPVAAES